MQSRVVLRASDWPSCRLRSSHFARGNGFARSQLSVHIDRLAFMNTRTD